MRLGDGDVRRCQMDVIGNQKLTNANGSSPGGGVQIRPAHVGLTVRVLGKARNQSLEAAMPDLLKTTSAFVWSGVPIEVDGQPECLPQILSQAMSKGNADLAGGAFERNKRNDVEGPDARVCTRVPPQVRSSRPPLRRPRKTAFATGPGSPDEGKHRAGCGRDPWSDPAVSRQAPTQWRIECAPQRAASCPSEKLGTHSIRLIFVLRACQRAQPAKISAATTSADKNV